MAALGPAPGSGLAAPNLNVASGNHAGPGAKPTRGQVQVRASASLDAKVTGSRGHPGHDPSRNAVEAGLCINGLCPRRGRFQHGLWRRRFEDVYRLHRKVGPA